MKRPRDPEEIIDKLNHAATLLAGGQQVNDVCRQLEISPTTYYSWRKRYGGMRPSQVEALEKLIENNRQLQRAVNDLSTQVQVLRSVVAGNW